MKALYIAFEELNPTSGISKKIVSQCAAFNRLGAEMPLLCFKREAGRLFSVIDGVEVYSFGSGKLKGIKCTYQFDYILRYIKKNGISFIYIRYFHFANSPMIHFLKQLRKEGVKVVMEVPTYPYDDEFRSKKFVIRVLHLVEMYFRKYLKKYVDRIASVQDYDSILGIPTVKISNGIDVDKISLRNIKTHEGINFLGVANAQFWHGYDRVISGLGDYYRKGGKQNIQFIIVGRNDFVINDLKRIAHENAVDERIHFEGTKEGVELDPYFDQADLAIGSLGGHRKGITDAKPLKCVEYAARGIPFVYSERNSDFDHTDFVKRVPDNESPIDIEDLIKFISSVSVKPEEMRSFVQNNLTWDKQMSKVLDSIR